MPNKIKGLGTVLQLSISSVFTAISQRVSIDGPDMSVATKDVSDLDSTSVRRKALLPDGGNLSLQIWYDPKDTTHALLVTRINNPPATLDQWKLIFQTSPTLTAAFDGILTKFKPGGMTTDGYLTADIEIQMDGIPVWT